MFPILLPLLASLASFSVPDTSAWHWRLDLTASGPTEIPGKEDFQEPDLGLFEISEPRSSATLGAFRIALQTPERGRWSAHASVAAGERTQKWQGLVVNSLYLALDVPSSDATKVKAMMTVNAPVMELGAGGEYHPWKRHFFGAEVVLPIQLGDGDLEYEVDGEVIHSGKAPSSFREAMTPRLMATYEYRLFDRINLGLGMSLWHGDFFAETPEADIDSLGRIRLEHGSTGAWIELHAGWTFGRGAP